MFNYLRNTIAITALFFSFTHIAQASTCQEKNALYPCGIDFTTIATTPTLAVHENATATYVITNQGAATRISINLNELDSLSDPSALTLDGASTCPNPGNLAASASCTIVLDFQPTVPGNLNWNLKVTPDSTQKPLVVNIQGTVQGNVTAAYVLNNANDTGGVGTVSYCPLNSDGTFGSGASNACTAVTLTFADSSTLNYPWSIVLNPSKTYAYISNEGEGIGTNVTICPVIDHVTFGSGGNPCFNTADDFGGPAGLAFSANGSKLYVANTSTPGAFPPDSTGGVSTCPVNINGSLGSCSYLSTGETARGIAFNSDYSLAYVSNSFASSAIFIYTVDSSGNLTYSSTFTDSNDTLNAPAGITVYSNKVFTANLFDTTISSCPVNGLTLDACSATSASGAFNNPVGLEFAALELVGNVFYVANATQISSQFTVAFCVAGAPTCTQLTDTTFDSPSDVLLLR